MHRILPFAVPPPPPPRPGPVPAGRVTIEHCAPCHGQDGIAKDSEVPHLAGQNERYLFNQLMAFRTGARRHREMRFMARELTEADIAALAAYYASLPPR